MAKTPGEIAFDAYAVQVGGRTHDGRPMPSWDQVGMSVRAGWEAAADAVGLAALEFATRQVQAAFAQTRASWEEYSGGAPAGQVQTLCVCGHHAVVHGGSGGWCTAKVETSNGVGFRVELVESPCWCTEFRPRPRSAGG
jgi:hypothetical protein